MRIIFTLKESLYDCKIRITDMQGSRYYLISAFNNNETTNPYITVDVYGDTFDLSLIPLMPTNVSS